MKNQESIFKVLDEFGNTRGTAFIYNMPQKNLYYLLTAYHVVSEAFAKKSLIIIQDYNYNNTLAQVIFPKEALPDYYSPSKDFAILKIFTEHLYTPIDILDYSETGDFYVRGAADHFLTDFSGYFGKITGLEKINGEEVLQLEIDTRQLVSTEGNEKQKQLFQGLSGSPIIVTKKKVEYCVGVLGHVEPDVAASKQYAVPIKAIMAIIPEYVLSIDQENTITDQELSLEMGSTIIDLVFGDTKNFSFSDEEAEPKAWSRLSDLFYEGKHIIVILDKLYKSGKFEYYNAEVKSTLLYYHARLLFKRGDDAIAIQKLKEITPFLPSLCPESRKKLETFLFGRMTIEKVKEGSPDSINKILRVQDEIHKISTISDELLAYEIASLIGKGLTNVFGSIGGINCFTDVDKKNMSLLLNEQKELVRKYPEALAKQDVVTTSLNWYFLLCGISKDLDALESIIRRGFEQAKQRNNTVFHISCLLAYSLCYLLQENSAAESHSSVLLLLSAKLLLKYNIPLRHEGIHTLLRLLEEKRINLYALTCESYNNKCIFNDCFINKNKGLVNSGRLKDICKNADDIYALLYSQTDPYKVNIVSVINMGLL